MTKSLLLLACLAAVQASPALARGEVTSRCLVLPPPAPGAVACGTQAYACAGQDPGGECLAVTCSLDYVYAERLTVLSHGVPAVITKARRQVLTARNTDEAGELPITVPAAAVTSLEATLSQRVLGYATTFIDEQAALACGAN